LSQPAQGPCDEAVVRGGAPALPCAAATQRWVLACAILGSSMAFVDGTVVNVALPSIQHDLRATAFEAQWVVESYALFLASLILVGGALGDRFGRRRIYALGVAIFLLASLGCALSRNVWELVFARGVQGIGAALLVPGSLALISASFPQSERGHAIGVWSAASAVTAAIGPVLGGFLVDRYSWSWAFLINVPLAMAVLAIAKWRVPESRGAAADAPLDVAGALLATVALGALVFAFIEGPARGWRSISVVLAWAAAAAGAVGFFAVELRRRSPMLPLKLFRNRDFAGANLLTLLLYAALGGGLFFFPLTLIQAQGYGAAAAGAALLPFIAVMSALSGQAGRLVDRYGPRPALIAGPLVAAAGFAGLALPGIGGSYWTSYFPAVVVLGLGMSLTVAPLTTTVMNAVGPEMAGVASGVNNAVSRSAALLAVAVFGLAVAAWFNARLDQALPTLGATTEWIEAVRSQSARLGALQAPQGTDAPLANELHRVVEGAYIGGFRLVMVLSAGLAVLSAVMAALFIATRSPR